MRWIMMDRIAFLDSTGLQDDGFIEEKENSIMNSVAVNAVCTVGADSDYNKPKTSTDSI
jgi:hypothetical protein